MATEIETPVGPALVVVDQPGADPVGLLVLGHGAGGGVDAVDLLAVRDAATAAGVLVARVTQPYRVAGRRAPAPATQLDPAWAAVVSWLRARYPGLPLVVGGRSSGARVACRTAVATGAAGVVALAFPLCPPNRSKPPEPPAPSTPPTPARQLRSGRAAGSRPADRSAELETGLPMLLVSGDRDRFGVPAGAPGRQVVTVPGAGHDLRTDPAAVGVAVVTWLRAMGWATDRAEVSP